MENTFEHVLKNPIKYGRGAEEALGFVLTLKSPTAKQRDYLIKLKQQFFTALANLRNTNKDGVDAQGAAEAQKDQDELDGTQLMMMLYMSGIDMVAFQNTFRALLLQGLVSFEGMALTSYLLDQIEQDEFEQIIGEYMTHFLLSSWTGTLNKN